MITTNFNDLLEVVEREETDGTFPPTKKQYGLHLPHLREIRKSLGLSTSDIAYFLDVGESTVGFYDAGKHGCKSIERVQKIAQVLGCTVEDLTTYEDLKKYHSKDNVATNSFGKKSTKSSASITNNPVRVKSFSKTTSSPSDKTNEQRISDLSDTLEDILSRLERVEGEKKSIWQRLFS